MFVSDSFLGAQSATPTEKGECERMSKGNEMRSSESERRDTKQFYCTTYTYIGNHPLALLAHAIQCLELHVTHFCLSVHFIYSPK